MSSTPTDSPSDQSTGDIQFRATDVTAERYQAANAAAIGPVKSSATAPNPTMSYGSEKGRRWPKSARSTRADATAFMSEPIRIHAVTSTESPLTAASMMRMVAPTASTIGHSRRGRLSSQAMKAPVAGHQTAGAPGSVINE